MHISHPSRHYTNIYKTTLLGISDLEKAIGRKAFKEIVSPYVFKPEGKPELAPLSDKREPIGMSSGGSYYSLYSQEAQSLTLIRDPTPKRQLFVDIETYSSENLPKGGVYRYAQAPDFQILLVTYGYDDRRYLR